MTAAHARGVVRTLLVALAAAVLLLGPSWDGVAAGAGGSLQVARSHQPGSTSRPVLLTSRHSGQGQAVRRSHPRSCRDRLVRVLRHAGFRGPDLREAWAIAMRESHGRARVVSRTGDYGLFQINAATYGTQPWWDAPRLLHARYNARVAYRLSQAGRTWAPWGLDGHGRARAHVYRSAGWSKHQIRSWILKPYRSYRSSFPC